MGRILKTAEAFGEIQKGLSFGMGKPPGGTPIWETLCGREGLLSPGWDVRGGAGCFFLDTRVEAERSSTGQHAGTTTMDTTGEEICPQLIKHLHGVRYLLVLNK